MGDAATGEGQGSGGMGQGWRREDAVGGWMDARKDGRTGHRKQETGKNKMEKEGKIMIRKPQLNCKITQKTPVKATAKDLGGAREDRRWGARARQRAQQGRCLPPSPEFHPGTHGMEGREPVPMSYPLTSTCPKINTNENLNS